MSVGKNDFDAIENVSQDRTFRLSLGSDRMLTVARLRQRFDDDARYLIPLIDDASVEFIERTRVSVTALPMGYVPLDMDGFPMDNSHTDKEGVSLTYKDTLGAFTYNILRWIGLMSLTGTLSPVYHPAKRRRIRTVMQELMYLAARLIESGRQLTLRFSRHCPGYPAFEYAYRRLATE